eukprot:scaffold8683_cov79-Skeletonema_dohrnii-CCMP3373.AAC.7
MVGSWEAERQQKMASPVRERIVAITTYSSVGFSDNGMLGAAFLTFLVTVIEICQNVSHPFVTPGKCRTGVMGH